MIRLTSSIREWLNLLVRWFHVFAAIMWVGQTYYFTWLDGQFTRLAKKAAGDGIPPQLWMVHSGGFYTVDEAEIPWCWHASKSTGFAGKR